MPETLRLGTRGSKLAVTQSQFVADALTKATGVHVDLVVISTRGDRIQDKPLPEIGGKGLFTAELEASLRSGGIDLAVHSLKDLPTADPRGLVLGAIPERVDPRDALVGVSLDALSEGAVVATGSVRRRMQMRMLRPDLELVDIRGNVPTRVAKVDDGHCDATILAMAGLMRLGISRADLHPFSTSQMVPAPGQGALGVQCRAGDVRVLDYLSQIEHPPTRTCVDAERLFLERFGGGCSVPAACFIDARGDGFRVVAVAENANGRPSRYEGTGASPLMLATQAVEALR